MDVSLEKGLASVKMKHDNAATFRQLQEAITKNGFTMKPSSVIVAGTVVAANGHPQLQVSDSNELVNLIADNSQSTNVAAMAGKRAIVQGTLEEAAKGKVPDTIKVHSISEDK